MKRHDCECMGFPENVNGRFFEYLYLSHFDGVCMKRKERDGEKKFKYSELAEGFLG
jgi:hypothetical protein